MDTPMKEGFMLKAHPKDGFFSMTVWQRRYFVLWRNGTIEYFTNYTKKGEEYSGTVNLVDCEDMVAPMSIGKRHNVIKLTIKNKDKLRDYLLDCEYPACLNEWVKCLADASGLAPEDTQPEEQFPIKEEINIGGNRSPFPLPNHGRPLPSLPAIMNMEYEVPKSIGKDGLNSPTETYEEIDTQPLSPTQIGGSDSLTRRYTRAASLKRDKQMTMVNGHIDKKSLLKRTAIQENGNISPQFDSMPVHMKQKQLFNPLQTDELQNKLSQRRQEMYGEIDKTQEISESGDFVGEEYEEVQFSTNVVVGTPRSAKRNAFNFKSHMTSQGNVTENGESYLDIIGSDDENSVSPAGYMDINSSSKSPPPSLPPKSIKPPPIPSRNQSSPDQIPNRTTPLPPPITRDHSSPPPLPPPRSHSNDTPVTNRQEQCSPPPPLPPPRSHNNDTLPITNHEEQCSPPPPVPVRNPNRRSLITDPRNEQQKPKKQIQPYRTTEIMCKSPVFDSSSDQSSGESEVTHLNMVSPDRFRSHSEATSTSPDQSVPSTQTGSLKPSKKPKPLPTLKPRPDRTFPIPPPKKLQKPPISSNNRPTISPSPYWETSLKPSEVQSSEQTFVETIEKPRPPAKLPKPKPSNKKPTPPSKSHLTHSLSPCLPELPPKLINPVASQSYLNGGPQNEFPKKKRPPMPPPKPKVY